MVVTPVSDWSHQVRNVYAGLSHETVVTSCGTAYGRTFQARLVAKERELQEKLDQLRTNLAKIEESVQMKTGTIRECRSKVSAISKELTTIGSGAAALEGVEQELAGAVSWCVGVAWTAWVWLG